MDILFVLIIWFALAYGNYYFATKLNRNEWGAAILSIFTSPLLVFLYLLIAGKKKNKD
tara:strand:+ start:2354 stop:2527 length:174 start_codon:yes stop_codon:yes gene_type:complete